MSPKTGRPPADGRTKDERITFRANSRDTEKIDYCCSKTGLSKSEVIRKGVDILYIQLKEKK